jgi:hypothetical protein
MGGEPFPGLPLIRRPPHDDGLLKRCLMVESEEPRSELQPTRETRRTGDYLEPALLFGLTILFTVVAIAVLPNRKAPAAPVELAMSPTNESTQLYSLLIRIAPPESELGNRYFLVGVIPSVAPAASPTSVSHLSLNVGPGLGFTRFYDCKSPECVASSQHGYVTLNFTFSRQSNPASVFNGQSSHTGETSFEVAIHNLVLSGNGESIIGQLPEFDTGSYTSQAPQITVSYQLTDAPAYQWSGAIDPDIVRKNILGCGPKPADQGPQVDEVNPSAHPAIRPKPSWQVPLSAWRAARRSVL